MTLEDRVEKLRIHLAEMHGECKDTEEVSEHLQRVRDLIKSLEECPGRDDFKLKIPEDTDEENEPLDGPGGIPVLGTSLKKEPALFIKNMNQNCWWGCHKK